MRFWDCSCRVFKLIPIYSIPKYEANTRTWESIANVINQVKDHPALLCYFIYDEPENVIPNPESDPDFLADVSTQVKNLDQTHLPLYNL